MLEFIHKEINIFKSLPGRTQTLLISYFFQGASVPLVGTFINAFIWRNQGDIYSLIIYNLGSFISLSIAFIISGYLLKKIPINRLYFGGTILVGLSGIIIVFFSRILNLNYIWYGFIYGLGNGFYWSARNYLTLKETNSESRNYFVSFGFGLDTITSILIPLAFGWFIAFTGKWTFLNIDGSYGVMIMVAFIFLLVSGYVILKNDFNAPFKSKIFLKKITASWIRARVLSGTLGFIEGIIFFIPTILILTKLGNEGILGSLNSVLAVFSAITLYLYGRKAQVHHQKPALILCITAGLIISAIFAFLHNTFSLLLFLSANGIILTFEWLTAYPIILNIIDREVETVNDDHFAYVVDEEIFLNIGRGISIAVLLTLHLTQSWEVAIYMSPFILYGMQILMLTVFSGGKGSEALFYIINKTGFPNIKQD
jgi:MFS transporter, YQGE family, putative transporter